MKVKIEIERDRMGNLTVRPSKKFLKAWSGKTWDDDEALQEGAFLQLSQHQEEVVSLVSRRSRRLLERGWGVSAFVPDYMAEAIFNCAY